MLLGAVAIRNDRFQSPTVAGRDAETDTGAHLCRLARKPDRVNPETDSFVSLRPLTPRRRSRIRAPLPPHLRGQCWRDPRRRLRRGHVGRRGDGHTDGGSLDGIRRSPRADGFAAIIGLLLCRERPIARTPGARYLTCLLRAPRGACPFAVAVPLSVLRGPAPRRSPRTTRRIHAA